MERKSLVAALALTVLPAFTASAATTFSFAGTLEGSNFGTFAAPFDLSPGTYDLSALGRFSLNFFFGPELTFSTMDIVTPLDQVAVKITPFAPRRREPRFCSDVLQRRYIYTALELTNSALWSLLFVATPDGENSFYEELTPEGPGFGNYLALSPVVPEPSTWTMMLLGFAGLGFVGYRASRKSAKVPLEQRRVAEILSPLASASRTRYGARLGPTARWPQIKHGYRPAKMKPVTADRSGSGGKGRRTERVSLCVHSGFVLSETAGA